MSPRPGHAPGTRHRHRRAENTSLCPRPFGQGQYLARSLKVPFLHKRPELNAPPRHGAARGRSYPPSTHRGDVSSMGERQLVRDAHASLLVTRVCILDEPTATLTDVEIERIFRGAPCGQHKGRSVLYITHRLAEVYAICDRVTVLRNGSDTSSPLSRTASTAHEPQPTMYPDETRARARAPLAVRRVVSPSMFEQFLNRRAQRPNLVHCRAGRTFGAAEIVRGPRGFGARPEQVTVNGRPLKLGSPARAARRGR